MRLFDFQKITVAIIYSVDSFATKIFWFIILNLPSILLSLLLEPTINNSIFFIIPLYFHLLSVIILFNLFCETKQIWSRTVEFLKKYSLYLITICMIIYIFFIDFIIVWFHLRQHAFGIALLILLGVFINSLFYFMYALSRQIPSKIELRSLIVSCFWITFRYPSRSCIVIALICLNAVIAFFIPVIYYIGLGVMILKICYGIIEKCYVRHLQAFQEGRKNEERNSIN